MIKEESPSTVLDALLQKIALVSGNIALQERIERAYELAQLLYGDVRNVSGLTKLEHGIRAAGTVLDLGQDEDAMLAAIFNHVEDSAEIALVKQEFGSGVSNLIQALRKLDIYTNASKRDTKRTLEAIRRAAFSIIDGDVRVVIIRLAMAIHTLRAASDLEFNTRSLIARDALHIYAPLANRLGIWTIKWELEDLSFRYLEPLQYKAIAKALDERREDRDDRIATAKRMLREELVQEEIAAEVTGRPKHIYSIYRKMQRKQVGFDEIFDAHALRIIVERDEPEIEDLTEEERKHKTYAQCYRALAIVHSLWEPVPSEFDDYIQHPKPNGYRSLHTAVYDSDGVVLEIQIRTRTMHEEAEQGFAAHWAYKEGGKPNPSLLRQIDALRRVLNDIGDSAEKTTQFDPFNRFDKLADINDETNERVYVFTPNGDLIDLAYGATPLDFAYAIHTMVGHRTRGAKINGKMVPLTYTLKSGDTVEIITFGKKDDEYSVGKPSRDWMNASAGYAALNKTRNRVRAWFRKHEREKNIEYGRLYVERELKRLSIGDAITYDELAAKFGKSIDDMLAEIGFGDITSNQLEGTLALILRDRQEEAAETIVEEEAEFEAPVRASQSRTSKGLTVMGMTGLQTKIAQCCTPIPPEPIVGYVTRGKGVTIHHAECKQVLMRKSAEPERIVEADWGNDVHSNDGYQVPFRLKAYRTAGLLEKIATVLRGQNIHLIKTKTTATRNRDHVNIFLLAEVRNLEQANWVADKLNDLKNVYEVAR